LRVSLIHGGVGYGKQREEAAPGMDIVSRRPGVCSITSGRAR
jgi:hypothetical protein